MRLQSEIVTLRGELAARTETPARPRWEPIPRSAPDAFAKITESAIPGRYRLFELGKDRGLVTLNADHTFVNEKGDNSPECTWTLSPDRLVLQYRRIAAHYTSVESPGVYAGLRTDNQRRAWRGSSNERSSPAANETDARLASTEVYRFTLSMALWPFGRKPDPFDAVLKQHIDDDFSMFACGKDAPSEADIRAFESSIGFKLPDDFRSFSKTPIGGIFIQAKESVWPRGTEFEVGPFWSFLYAVFVYGFAKDIPEWMDIRIATQSFRVDSGTNFVPCLKVVSNADVYCLDPEGRVRQWDHETGETEIYEGTFLDLYTREVTELRKRKDRMKAGEGARQTLPPRIPPPLPPPLP